MVHANHKFAFLHSPFYANKSRSAIPQQCLLNTKPSTCIQTKRIIPRTPRMCIGDNVEDESWKSIVPNSTSFKTLSLENDSSSLDTSDYDKGSGSGTPPRSSDDGNNDKDEGPQNEIVQKLGLSQDSMAPELRTLSMDQLTRFLGAIKNPITCFFARIWPGWRRRVLADPDFPFKLLMEETVGLGLAASGMIAARGKNILAELDFALCDIAVGATLNFILVYLLTPVAGVAAAGPLTKLPANVFSPGNYNILLRGSAFLYKGVLFGVCGFMGSVVGTTLSQGLIQARKKISQMQGKANPDAKKLPNIAITSAAWAGFMFFSSNPRYQAIAGMERLLFGLAPKSVAQLSCGFLRTGNNVLGGAIWVWWAKMLKIQETDEKAEVSE